MGRLQEHSGVANCTCHTFRRTFALTCLPNGMNIYVQARLMGHADITILRQYLPLIEDDLQEAHARFGAGASKSCQETRKTVGICGRTATSGTTIDRTQPLAPRVLLRRRVSQVSASFPHTASGIRKGAKACLPQGVQQHPRAPL